MSRVLCSLVDPDTTGAKEVMLERGGKRASVFVVRHGEVVMGYVNSCPHARLPLNLWDDRFHDLTRAYILCVNHGALFEIETGLCVRGPCKGKTLATIPVRVEGDVIVVDDVLPNA